MTRTSENILLVHTADGTAGSGKGTVGSQLEGVPVLDTGQGYRAVFEFWLRCQEDSSQGFDRSDEERVENRVSVFAADEEKVEKFAGLLEENVHFGVEGLAIGQDSIEADRIRQVLNADVVNRNVSLIARKQAVRDFCGGISVRFVREAVEREYSEVYLDGRTERQVMIRAFQGGELSTEIARLALPAYFYARPKEAARRTLSRDTGRDYASLCYDDDEVVKEADKLRRRNQRDSDKANVDPMRITQGYLWAWRHDPDSFTVQTVLGSSRDGSESRNVLLDTTDCSITETFKEYNRWRVKIVEYLRSLENAGT